MLPSSRHFALFSRWPRKSFPFRYDYSTSNENVNTAKRIIWRDSRSRRGLPGSRLRIASGVPPRAGLEIRRTSPGKIHHQISLDSNTRRFLTFFSTIFHIQPYSTYLIDPTSIKVKHICLFFFRELYDFLVALLARRFHRYRPICRVIKTLVANEKRRVQW